MQEEPSVTYSVQHKQIMETLFRHFPNKFNVADQIYYSEAHRLFGYSASTPRFIIDPIMTKGSFLDTPVWSGEAANTGIWPLQTRFPRGVLPYKSGFRLKPPGRPFDIDIKDAVLKAFLEAPKISEANLDATVFYSSQTIKLSGYQFVNTDYFLRQGMIDTFYTEELVNCAMQFTSKVRDELREMFGYFTSEAVDFLEKILGLISFSNQRATHNNVAALVANRTAMRQQVMSRLQVPPKTAQMLKNSSFTSEGVFGELPQ